MPGSNLLKALRRTRLRSTGRQRAVMLKRSLRHLEGNLTGIVGHFSEFADLLSLNVQRPFVDATGLVGKFEIAPKFDPATLLTRRDGS